MQELIIIVNLWMAIRYKFVFHLKRLGGQDKKGQRDVPFD